MRQLKIYKSITNKSSDSINSYFSEVSKIQMLTEEEEISQFKKVSKGDKLALDKVVNANLRFVISVAKQYQNQGLTLEDLISEGNIGLIKAAHRFDNTRGFKFISYAVWWIRQSIMQSIADNARIIRLPNNHINSLKKINKLSAKLEQSLEREPTIDELEHVLEEMDIKLKNSTEYNYKITSLDAPVTEGEDLFLYEIIENKDGPQPDDSFKNESLSKDIEKVLDRLNSRQKTIVSMYYGLLGHQPMTLEEIGEYFDLTRERVRQIKDMAIRVLKNRSNSKVLKQHI